MKYDDECTCCSGRRLLRAIHADVHMILDILQTSKPDLSAEDATVLAATKKVQEAQSHIPPRVPPVGK